MILKQAECYLDERKRVKLARGFVLGAIENIKKVLLYYHNRGKGLGEIIEKIKVIAKDIDRLDTPEKLMAIEGNVREQYYKAFDKILDNEHFIFEGRTRKPPRNRLNALISFGNSLLYTISLSEIYKTHLDPRISYLHASNFRRFSLNLDVAEVFKPVIVDRVIFKLINKGMIKSKHFESRLEGVLLNEKGRRQFIEELDKRLKSTIRHVRLGRDVSYRRLIRLELYKIQRHIMGEEEYVPFVSGW